MAGNLIALPDTGHGWRLFSGKKEVGDGRDLQEAVGKKAGILVGLPAASISTFSFIVPTTESNLFEPMAFAQLEKRGLVTGDMESTVFDIDVIDQHSGETTLAVHVVTDDLSDDLILPSAAGYAPSALVRDRAEEGAVLWQEHNKLAIGFFQKGRLVHTQLLSGQSKIGPAVAQEINLLLLSLQSEPLFASDPPNQCSAFVENVSDADQRAFADALKIPCSFISPQGGYRKAKARPKLTPRQVLAARKRKKLGRTVGFLILLGLVAYSVAGVWLWKKKETTEMQLSSLERQVATLEPDVIALKQATAKWETLEPAFDLKWFPVVQLDQITGALPGTGVRITEYRTKGRSIKITGQARDVQFAFRLLEDLKALPAFEAYTWNMPQPKVEKNNTAAFIIEGRPEDEGT
ncbi:MAG: hypothetical protein AAF226_13080 [Verrucomicrobiota bacterium]